MAENVSDSASEKNKDAVAAVNRLASQLVAVLNTAAGVATNEPVTAVVALMLVLKSVFRYLPADGVPPWIDKLRVVVDESVGAIGDTSLVSASDPVTPADTATEPPLPPQYAAQVGEWRMLAARMSPEYAEPAGRLAQGIVDLVSAEADRIKSAGGRVNGMAMLGGELLALQVLLADAPAKVAFAGLKQAIQTVLRETLGITTVANEVVGGGEQGSVQ